MPFESFDDWLKSTGGQPSGPVSPAQTQPITLSKPTQQKSGFLDFVNRVGPKVQKIGETVTNAAGEVFHGPAVASLTAFRAAQGISSLAAYAMLKKAGKDKAARDLLVEINKNATKKTVLPGFSQGIEPANNLAKAAGAGFETGALIAPVGAASTEGKGALNLLFQASKNEGIRGGLFGAGRALQKKNPTGQDVFKEGLLGFLAGTGGGALFRGLASKFKPNVQHAIQGPDYVREINASTELSKQYSEFPKEALFQENGKLQPQFAEGRINDVAEKLDDFYPGQHLGDQFRKSVDVGNTSLEELRSKATGLLPIGTETAAPIGAEKDVVENELLKQRSLSKNIAESSPEEVKSKLNSAIESFYKPVTDKAAIAKANELIGDTPESLVAAERIARNPNPTKVSNVVGQILVERYIKQGNFDQAIDLTQDLSSKVTTSGQAVQAFSLWSKLTPAGSLRYAQKVIQTANEDNPQLQLSLSEEAAKQITDIASRLQDLPDGRDKVVETAKLLDTIAAQVPPSTSQKLAALQRLAQLLNPKTAIRNTLGNVGFAGIEDVAQTVATPIDIVTSALRGSPRTTTLPSIATQLAGAKEGWHLGLEDALSGVNTANLPTQADIGSRTFRTGLLGKAETGLNVELRAADRVFYQAAYNDTLRQQMSLAGVSEPTPEMEALADYEARYRTFQDDTPIARGLAQIKKGLNILTGSPKFGAGNILINYPRTPGNILARGIDFTPAGFFNTVWQMARPLFGQEFDQRAFSLATSRALVGTVGLVGTGALLHKIGIITGKRVQNQDLRNVQAEAGLNAYQLNISALKRFVTSGFKTDSGKMQKGDTLVTYDWFQPQAIGLAMGANIDENKGISGKGLLGSVASSLQGGVETIAELPLVRNLTSITQGFSLSQSFQNALEQIPASLVPTLSNQLRIFVDNTRRNTYAPSPVRSAVNLFLMRVPYASQSLAPKIGPSGKEQEIYQTQGKGLRKNLTQIFNIFFNPSFVTQYRPNQAAELALNIYQSTGQLSQLPRTAPNTLRFYSHTLQLNASQIADIQRFIGVATTDVFMRLAQDSSFMALPDEEKAKYMGTFLTKIGTAAKQKFIVDQIKQKGLSGLPIKPQVTPQ